MSVAKGHFQETQEVRVATFKKTGKRYLLSFFNGVTAHLWGEMLEFKGLRSSHEKMFRVHENEITWADAKKTPALCFAMLAQATLAKEHVAVMKTAHGGKLFSLDEKKPDVFQEAVDSTVRDMKLSRADRASLLEIFARVD